MKELIEGKLRFCFGNALQAEKYDDWSHYRNQFIKICGGAKAVDFIVIDGATLWLIEVKDYRHHKRQKSTDLIEEIALKVKDTLSGIVSASFNSSDSNQKSFSRSALRCTTLKVVFHLEQPKTPNMRLYNPQDLQIKLRQNLRFADPHASISSLGHMPASLNVIVESI